jgi:YVTN family beta-propeller protein
MSTVSVINGASTTNTTITVALSSPTNPAFASSVSVNSITNKIYVSYAFSGAQAYIGVIDGATNTITALSPVQVGNCPNGAAVNPVTNRTYVANTGVDCGGGSANISIIDGSLNVTGSASASVGAGVGALVLNPITNTLYAVNTAGAAAVNGANLGAAPTSISLPAGGFAGALNPVQNKAYVADNNTSLQVIDAQNGNAVTSVTVGSKPQGVAVNPATYKIYVTNSNSASLTVVDGATNSVDATVAVGNDPVAVAVNPNTNRIYVANYNDGTVSIVDGLSKTVLATATVGTHPHDIQINPLTNFIYVANQGGGASGISVINGATNTVTQLATPSGAVPWAVAVDTGTNEIYVLNHQAAGSVTVVLGATATTAARLAATLPNGVMLTGGTIALGASTTPNAVAVNLLTHRIYIASAGTNGLIYLDGATGAVVKGPSGVGGMAYVAVNTVTNLVYVVSTAGQLYVVGPDAAPGSLPVFPLTTTIAGDPSDPLTISSGTATTPYQTYNPAPTINVTVNSTFTASTTYGSIGYATNPPPATLYYTIDGGTPSTVAVAPSAIPLPNPGVFNLGLPNQTACTRCTCIPPTAPMVGLRTAEVERLAATCPSSAIWHPMPSRSHLFQPRPWSWQILTHSFRAQALRLPLP